MIHFLTRERPFLSVDSSSTAAPLKVFKAHLPATFDDSATKPEWLAYACWIVSAVVIRRYIERGANETTFVPLDSRYINGHIPRRVRGPLLKDLLQSGILECDGVYYFGHKSGRKLGRHIKGVPGKCFCYRLGELHRTAKIQARDITHPELLKKMKSFRQIERDAITDPVLISLRDWHDWVEVLPTAPRGEHPLLDSIINGERRFTVCAQGRVHTNVANLPRQYRQHLRLDDRELVSCDISTSQPLLLALFLRNQMKSKGREERGNREAVCVPCSDCYLMDCLDGTVYDRVVERTGYSRDDVKAMFLAVIYGHPEHMETKVGVAIRQLYPSVFKAVVDLNFRLGHGGLPRLMQKLESNVMISRVAARLFREQPTMPLLTVHDCVLVPPEYVGLAQRIITEEWIAEFGVAPQVKTSMFMAPQEPRKKRRRPRQQTDGVPLAS